MPELTENDIRFIRGMAAAVEQRGENFEYPMPPKSRDDDWHRDGACVYSRPDGTPACIVGLAIQISDIGEVPAYAAPVQEASVYLRDMGISPKVRDAADHAQVIQDTGQSWDYVLEAFHARLNREGVNLDGII